MKKVLLDTNAFTALFRGDQAILDVIGRAECVYASAVVIGELEAGFRGGSRYADNLDILECFLMKLTVDILPVGRETSELFNDDN